MSVVREALASAEKHEAYRRNGKLNELPFSLSMSICVAVHMSLIPTLRWTAIPGNASEMYPATSVVPSCVLTVMLRRFMIRSC